MKKPLLLGILLITLSWTATAVFGAGSGTGSGSSSGTGDSGGAAATCGAGYIAYGYALPGDPDYSFGYADNKTKNLLGLAAKGNIVIGNYTAIDFANKVLPALTPSLPTNPRQPYAVDPTDAGLGYGNANALFCGGRSPCFDGDYNQVDGGTKQDGTQRKFYESSLSDANWNNAINTVNTLYTQDKTAAGRLYDSSSSTGWPKIEGVLLANHGIIGFTPAFSVRFDGAMVGRDDLFYFGRELDLNHDIRLIDNPAVGPPVLTAAAGITRPQRVSWQECTSATPCN